MILARAPLRLPLGGGGTDLPSYYSRFGGFFISAAINKYVYVSVNRPAADDLIRVKYSRSEEVTDPAQLQHDLVRPALLQMGFERNLEIASMADVPAGTGLGSSGSYLAALLTALHALKRDHVPRWALAEEACHIEMNLAGHPVGKQDQYVASWGGLNCYKVTQSGEVTATPLKIPAYALEDLERASLLFYIGQARSSSTLLGAQKDATERGDETVVESLHRTKQLAYEIRDALERGDLAEFGAQLHKHWVNKRARTSGISDGRIDALYERAKAAGALGGKLVGAGGGGFLMLLVESQCQRSVRDAMAEEGIRTMPFNFDLEGAKVLLDV